MSDRQYSADAFLENLDALQRLGRDSVSLPEALGREGSSVAPLFSLDLLRKHILEAACSQPVDLGGGLTLTVRRLEGGAFVSIRGTF